MTVQGKTFDYNGDYQGHKYMTVVTEFTSSGLQELCDGSDCNQQEFLQELCDGSDCNQMHFLQQLCDGSDCNQMHFMQELYQSQNLTHWVIEGKCYQKAVPANIMAEVLKAPINGLAGGCIVGGYTQKAGSVSANVATFGDVVLDEYTQPSLMMI